MDIGCALAEGVVEEVVDGVDDVAIGGVDFFELSNRHELFEVSDGELGLIDRRRLFGSGSGHARFKAVDFGNRAHDSRFRSEDGGDIVALHLSQGSDEFIVSRHFDGDRQDVLAQRDGEHDVHFGEVLAERLRDEFLVEAQRVDAHVGNVCGMRPDFDDFFFVERGAIGGRSARSHDDFDGRGFIARLGGFFFFDDGADDALAYANHLRLFEREHVFSSQDVEEFQKGVLSEVHFSEIPKSVIRGTMCRARYAVGRI